MFRFSLGISTFQSKWIVSFLIWLGILGSKIKKSEFRSLITFDKGGEWRPLQPPETDSDGNQYDGCSSGEYGCYLQLHSTVSNALVGHQNILSLKQAPGLLMAHGNVGHFLDHKVVPNLYLSRDGGYQWTETLKGVYNFVVADHGGIIMAVNK